MATYNGDFDMDEIDLNPISPIFIEHIDENDRHKANKEYEEFYL